jgi:hypothetical protein
VRVLTGADYGVGVTVSGATPAAAPGAADSSAARTTYHIAVTGEGTERIARGRSMPSPEVTMQRGATHAAIELIALLSQ